jgi:hypothetical protein
MPDSSTRLCPKCNQSMELGRVAGAWGRSLRAATIDWIPVDADGEEKEGTLFTEKEELADHPLTNFSPSPRFDAARCAACRLIIFQY